MNCCLVTSPSKNMYINPNATLIKKIGTNINGTCYKNLEGLRI